MFVKLRKKLLIIIVFDAVHELPKAMPKDVIKVSNLYHYSKHKKNHGMRASERKKEAEFCDESKKVVV